jgi:hypothetical protein
MRNKGESEQQNQTFTTLPVVSGKKTHHLFRNLGLLLLGVVLVCSAVGAYLYTTGFMKVSFGAENTIVKATSSVVCDSAVVSDYNTLTTATYTTLDDRAKALQKIQDFSKDIQTKKGYLSDATCVYIAYLAAITAGDKAKATGYVDTIESFARQGIFTDTRLNGISSIEQMRATVQTTTQSADGLQGAG